MPSPLSLGTNPLFSFDGTELYGASGFSRVDLNLQNLSPRKVLSSSQRSSQSNYRECGPESAQNQREVRTRGRMYKKSTDSKRSVSISSGIIMGFFIESHDNPRARNQDLGCSREFSKIHDNSPKRKTAQVHDQFLPLICNSALAYYITGTGIAEPTNIYVPRQTLSELWYH
ncbi:hypothetical protein BGAL_0141g00090 [Botrytis galanthina]|uniref:Uncharacterized protein n=1 Tax=Botrytis galanthina TaxID=278940 RepID=A0A4S8R009_9HELO|nr:hypothetical protein BGAL_0141g00090 [Botrytis galanthina]